MNILYSIQSVGKAIRTLGMGISERTYGGVRGVDRELPSLFALFCWILILGVLLLMVSGCGRSSKQQIERLNAEVKKLTEENARLNQEKNALSRDLRASSDRIAAMQQELNDLNKAKARLSAEDKEIRQKNTLAEEEIASLKSEKSRLAQEVEQLKKRMAEMASPPKLSATMPAEVDPSRAKRSEKLSPCDAVTAFMKASEDVMTRQRGEERTKLLEQVKQQHAEKMKDAPEKAIKAAENWVKEYAKLWEAYSSDGVFRLLQLQGVVFRACGKSSDEMEFK